MRSTTTPLKLYSSTYTFVTEHYGSMSELLQVADSRNLRYANLYGSDYLTEGRFSGGRNFYGFDTSGELRTMIREGIRDETFSSKVRRLQSSIMVKDEDKLCHMRRDVCGGAVNVPAFLQGVPECMVRQVRKPVKSKVLNLVIQNSYTSDTNIEDLERTSYALAVTIASLERSGYRVGVTVTGSFCQRKSGKILTAALPMKKPNEPLNISKMMFMIASRAFFRGLLFGWVVKCPEMENNPTLGTSLGNMFYSEASRDFSDAYFKKEFGQDAQLISVERFIEDMGRVRREARDKIPDNTEKAKAQREEYVLARMSKNIEASLLG